MAAPDPKFWCRGCVRIMDAPHLHEEIYAILGEGTECHEKGDDRPNHPGSFWNNDIWILEAPVSERFEIAEHLRWLCEFLEPHEAFVRNWISRGARVDLYFSYACNDCHRGFGIPGSLLAVFSRLDIPLEVSIMT